MVVHNSMVEVAFMPESLQYFLITLGMDHHERKKILCVDDGQCNALSVC